MDLFNAGVPKFNENNGYIYKGKAECPVCCAREKPSDVVEYCEYCKGERYVSNIVDSVAVVKGILPLTRKVEISKDLNLANIGQVVFFMYKGEWLSGYVQTISKESCSIVCNSHPLSETPNVFYESELEVYFFFTGK